MDQLDSERKVTYSIKQLVEISRGISYGVVQPGTFLKYGIPFVRVNNLTENKLNIIDVEKISPEIESKYKRTRLNGTEILVSLVGSLGHIAIAKPHMKGWNVARAVGVLPIRAEFDREWIFWYLKSPKAQHALFNAATTSVQATINLKELQEIEIEYPDEKFRKIANSILSALDDKIELNRRTNHTLEQMAQTLFKKYFVDDIDPDNLPEGWRWGKLGDIYKTTSGGTPSRSIHEYYENGTIAWVKSKELDGGFILETEEVITQIAIKKSSAKMLPLHSVLLAMYGATVGEVAILSIPAACNQAICAIIPNTDFPYTFIFQFLKLNKEYIVNRASGSAQQNISQVIIQNFEIPIPPSSVVKEFDRRVSLLFEKIESNLKEIKSLTIIRDTLLPKLMSGEIEV